MKAFKQLVSDTIERFNNSDVKRKLNMHEQENIKTLPKVLAGVDLGLVELAIQELAQQNKEEGTKLPLSQVRRTIKTGLEETFKQETGYTLILNYNYIVTFLQRRSSWPKFIERYPEYRNKEMPIKYQYLRARYKK